MRPALRARSSQRAPKTREGLGQTPLIQVELLPQVIGLIERSGPGDELDQIDKGADEFQPVLLRAQRQAKVHHHRQPALSRLGQNAIGVRHGACKGVVTHFGFFL